MIYVNYMTLTFRKNDKNENNNANNLTPPHKKKDQQKGKRP